MGGAQHCGRFSARGEFFNLNLHNFIRVAVATPAVRVADPDSNLRGTLELMEEAACAKAILAVFPELGLSAYSCENLFHQQVLVDSAEAALSTLLARTRQLPVAALAGRRAPFGTHLLFRHGEQERFVLYAEICEDLWVPAPPSSFAALAGATVITNLSASNVAIGKGRYRRELASNQSARCLAAYLYSAAGMGESTTDLAWDGHAMVWESGSLLAESRMARRPCARARA